MNGQKSPVKKDEPNNIFPPAGMLPPEVQQPTVVAAVNQAGNIPPVAQVAPLPRFVNPAAAAATPLMNPIEVNPLANSQPIPTPIATPVDVPTVTPVLATPVEIPIVPAAANGQMDVSFGTVPVPTVVPVFAQRPHEMLDMDDQGCQLIPVDPSNPAAVAAAAAANGMQFPPPSAPPPMAMTPVPQVPDHESNRQIIPPRDEDRITPGRFVPPVSLI